MLARRIFFPLRFAVRRVTAARRSLSVAALGVALASCALAAAFAASAIVENRAVADAVDELPPTERDVEVTWVGLSTAPSGGLDALDEQARGALGSVGLALSARTLLYRNTRVDGQVVRIAAADDLARWFVIRRGRFPQACTPARCETVVIGSGLMPRISGLPVVGVAEPRPGTPVHRLLGTATARVPLLVAEGVAGADQLAIFESAFRSYTWSAPLVAARPTAWTLNEFEQKLTLARTRLQAASFRFGLSAPVDSLDDVALDARVAYRRLLVGGECAVLFLVFALLAASSLRPNALAASRRLRRLGARRWQTDLLAAAEAAVVVVPATALGWAAGALLAAGLAAATDTPLRPLLERTILSSTGLALAASLAALAVLILFATMRAQPVLIRGRGISLVDAAAGAALVAVIVALAVGETDAETLARDRGTGIV